MTIRDYEKLCVNIDKEDFIAWEDPESNDLLIQYENENETIYQIPINSEDEKVEKSSSPAENYLHFWLNEVSRASTGAGRKNLDEEWTSWRFWDDFGSVKDIIKAYEDIFKFEEIVCDISWTENKGRLEKRNLNNTKDIRMFDIDGKLLSKRQKDKYCKGPLKQNNRMYLSKSLQVK